MDEWLKIIGALGGLEAIRFTVTFLANRKTNARKEKATADSMELQNLLSIIDNLNKQIERYDERLKQRDEKVDTIYREWRTPLPFRCCFMTGYPYFSAIICRFYSIIPMIFFIFV